MDNVESPYRKSSYSGQQSNCVEVAATADGGRAVRDSKDQAGPSLRFAPEAWSAFVAAARNGEFEG
jgi:hypothetical protein